MASSTDSRVGQPVLGTVLRVPPRMRGAHGIEHLFLDPLTQRYASSAADHEAERHGVRGLVRERFAGFVFREGTARGLGGAIRRYQLYEIQ